MNHKHGRIWALAAGIGIGTCLQLVISGRALQYQPVSPVPPPNAAIAIAPPPPDLLFTHLVPPTDDASTERWLAFAQQVKATDNGTRHDNYDYTTPLLPWYVYIARRHPEAIYRFYAERQIGARTFSHLLQFGLLPEWYQRLPDARALLLKDSTALINLATHQGLDFARAELIGAIRERREERFSIDGDHLRLAMGAMDGNEVLQLFARVQSGEIIVDPRHLRPLETVSELNGMQGELLTAIATQALKGYADRGMSSYFLHGAELGEAHYVEEMLKDAGDNAGQPNNFYCAACYLALVSDGLIGSTLIEHLDDGDRVYVTARDSANPFFGTSGEREYLLSLQPAGGAR